MAALIIPIIVQSITVSFEILYILLIFSMAAIWYTCLILLKFFIHILYIGNDRCSNFGCIIF